MSSKYITPKGYDPDPTLEKQKRAAAQSAGKKTPKRMPMQQGPQMTPGNKRVAIQPRKSM